ncbi:brain and acute leukemia cytoplasmic protein-like isoform X1 [Sinocyclocheilus grahami]|uniref:brain and acute leukemia cytoplasmic protein-like isoform X1 n=1 Tax=Sinocyclocheilus grahami TaxID=75366 RepID=UPI0007ACB37B|nr:PREDICTED: brain and acute leukemia cytoplasmic protein-like isoform X1 [Sinocyclocheilus grahami]
MGCGGSRADAIEPRYHESWTRETESTWLTNTDAEIPNGVTSKNRVVRGESSHLIKDNSKLSGRGMEARSCGDRGRQMVNAGTQCGKQVLTSSTCTKTSCSHEQISDSKQTTHEEETTHSEGVSSNAASNPGEP